MPIEIACGNCLNAFGVEADWAGMAVECPFCQTAVGVPEEVRDLAAASSQENAASVSFEPPPTLAENETDLAITIDAPAFDIFPSTPNPPAPIQAPRIAIDTDVAKRDVSKPDVAKRRVPENLPEKRTPGPQAENPRAQDPQAKDGSVASGNRELDSQASHPRGSRESPAKQARRREKSDRSRWKGAAPGTNASSNQNKSAEPPANELENNPATGAPTSPASLAPILAAPGASAAAAQDSADETSAPARDGLGAAEIQGTEAETTAGGADAAAGTGSLPQRMYRPPPPFGLPRQAPRIERKTPEILVRQGLTEIEYRGQKMVLRDQPEAVRYYGLIAFGISVFLLIVVLTYLALR